MNYYEEIKNKIIDDEVYAKVKDYSKEQHRVITYFEIGRLLHEAGKQYGEGIIKEYSKRLTEELGKGYTFTAFPIMKKLFSLLEKLATVSQQLTYCHYIELLPINEINKVKYYIKVTEEQCLSIRNLRSRIKSNEYERLSVEKRNKMISNDDVSITDLVPNSIIIKSNEKEIYELY